MSRLVLFLLLLVMAPGVVTPVQAQSVIRGWVRDGSTGAALGDAVVVLIGGEAHRSATTDPRGAFALRANVPAGWLLVARIGYRPDTVEARPGAPVDVALEPAPLSLAPVVVAVEALGHAASDRHLRLVDMDLRPTRSSQDLLRLLPGLVIAQHAGGGKAEQIFLRGFDADHGTDVAISVDGTPVNMVSHAHGQGYADLHFLPPELVETVEIRKGPLDARDGNLATAGAVEFRTRREMPLTAELGTGRFGELAGFGAVPLRGRLGAGYLAAAYRRSDGPFQSPQGAERVNLFGRLAVSLDGGLELVTTASAFASDWSASGQVPERAVASGTIGRFGAIDDSEGGSTSRHEMAAALRGRTGPGSWQLRAYAVRYRFDLFSNFTFFARDPVNGDGIEQVDERWMAGAAFDATWSALRAGVGLRADAGTVLLAAQQRRARLGDLSASRVAERHLFAYMSRDLVLGSVALLTLGLRGDAFLFDVADQTDGAPPDGIDRPRAEGRRARARVSPKVTLSHTLAAGTTLFAGAGLGFHSNDARDVVLADRAATVLPRAAGLETGVRRHADGVSVGIALWLTDLQSELVFVGDEGVTEPSSRTRRMGIDAEARVRITPWLWADADLSLARARLRDAPTGADEVPLAPRRAFTGGLTFRDLGPVAGAIRVRHVGSRPADEASEVRARGYTVADAAVTLKGRCLGATLGVDNILDVAWNEAQFATTSRLRDEPREVTELHFTPGAPRSARVSVQVRC